MRLVLHIGPGKTGTTVIQNTFHKNRDWLLEQGIFYPGFAENHSLLTLPFRDRVPRVYWGPYGKDLKELEQRVKPIWHAIGQNAVDAETIVISSEHFWEITQFKKLAAFIKRYLPSVTQIDVVAYVRRHSTWFPSIAVQDLRASHVLPPLQQRTIAGRLALFEQIGVVHVSEYHQTRLIEQDAAIDFRQHHLKLTASPPLPADNVNPSLTTEGAYILQNFRAQAFGGQPNVFNRLSSSLMARLLGIDAANPGVFTRVQLLPRYAEMLDRCSEDLLLLEEAYKIRLYDGEQQPGEFPPIKSVTDMMPVDMEKVQFMNRALLERAWPTDKNLKDVLADGMHPEILLYQ